ncbi:MAG: DUF2788 domain-containing protein [Methylotenera sp.]|jgi:hypothetical protein|nr:DUF2788 domain-containing protein [Methylotenera sp.]NOT66053.1 DUF2788 domain-containing protein [Methylotenera sp.]
MEGTIFGFTEAQITELGMTYGVWGLMLLMIFIVGHLAWESKVGKFGTFILFLGLTFGLVGFIAKSVIQHYMKV